MFVLVKFDITRYRIIYDDKKEWVRLLGGKPHCTY